jgi:beta-alanine degradation protein BauB
MKCSIRTAVSAALLAVFSFCASSVMAQDPAKVASDIYKVRLDNAKVRVLEVTGKAGQKAAMHRHPGYVVYSLADGSVRFTDTKGAAAEAPMKTGETMWRDAEGHASEVLSDIHVLLFELKKPKGAGAAKGNDPVSVDSGHYKVLLDNDRVRVIVYSAGPGEKTPMHSHPDYVTYILEGSKTKFSYPNGKTAEAESKTGDVVWHKAETHAGEVIGGTGIRVLIVELK